MKRRILISSPNAYDNYVFLPLVWGLLKSAVEREPVVRNSFEWLEPIYDSAGVQRILDSIFPEIHVLGLSNFMWNFEANNLIARKIKERFPNCVVIAGGAHNSWEDPSFFKNYPWIDVVVMGEGEFAFTSLLKNLDRREEWKNIPGLLVGPDGMRTAPRMRLKTFTVDVYEEHAGEYRKMIEVIRSHGKTILAALETDRGCPFQCTFCDWGSDINTRVRRGIKDEIIRSIDWLTKNGIGIIYMTSANFGLLGDDFEVAQHIVACRNNYSTFKQVHFNMAKANSMNILRIAKELYRGDVIKYLTIPVQTTNNESLLAVKRKSLSEGGMAAIVNSLQVVNIPMVTELVIGLPGDTPEKFIDTIDELAEKGILNHFIYLFVILPNAEASEPKYRSDWDIQTVTRYAFVSRRKINYKFGTPVEMCVATKTYSREEYAYTLSLSTLYLALLKRGIARPLSLYLHWEKGLPISTVSRLLLDATLDGRLKGFTATLLLEIHKHWQSFVSPEVGADQAYEEILSSRLSSTLANLDFMPYPEEILVQVLLENIDQFFDDLTGLLSANMDISPELRSLVEFNKDFLITPNYDFREGLVLTSNYDWYRYFTVTCWGEQPGRRVPVQRVFTQYSVCDEDSLLRSGEKMDWVLEGDIQVRAERFFDLMIPSRYDDNILPFFQKVTSDMSGSDIAVV